MCGFLNRAVIWTTVLSLSISGMSAAESPTESARLILKPDQVRQEIDGFGASGAWWSQIIGDWPDAKRERIVDLLYGPDGAALSIYRYNVGAGSKQDIKDPWRGAETFEVAAGQYDWSRDRAAVRILNEVCARGDVQVILFANSPPKRMTKSGFAYARPESGTSNLAEDKYEQFADYLLDVTEHFLDEGIPVAALSPINEPQWDWGGDDQEGCHYEPEEVARLVEILLGKLKHRNLGIRLEAPENGSWERVEEPDGDDWYKSPVYLRTLFSNPKIDSGLKGYAFHSYWAELEHKKAFADYFFAKYPEKKLHMTEWCEMVSGRDYGMDSAINMATVIVDDLVEGGVSSWQCWIAVSRYNYRDGLIYVDQADQKIHAIKRLWAMANFSRFVRPGFCRFEVANDSTDLKVVGCLEPGTGKVVLVAVNGSANTVDSQIDLPGAGPPEEFRVFETSEQRDLGRRTDAKWSGRCAFAPRSVTTLVMELAP